MGKVKKDLVILKNGGRIHIVRNSMVEKDNIIKILDGHSAPTYANSPYVNQFQGAFFNDGNYKLVKNVEIDEEIIGNHFRYAYDEVTKTVKLIDLYQGAGYAASINKLHEEIASLKAEKERA